MAHDNLTPEEQAEFDRLTAKKKAFNAAKVLEDKVKGTVKAFRYIADRMEVCVDHGIHFNLDVSVREPERDPRSFRTEQYPYGPGLYVTAFISYQDYPQIEELMKQKV